MKKLNKTTIELEHIRPFGIDVWNTDTQDKVMLAYINSHQLDVINWVKWEDTNFDGRTMYCDIFYWMTE